MMKRSTLFIFAALLAVKVVACQGEQPASEPKQSVEFVKPKPEEKKPEAKPEEKPAEAKELPALPPEQDEVQAPDEFTVKLDTTQGEVIIDVNRKWSPKGADRFYNLVKQGYYTDVAFFRVLDGFMAQAGINGDPRLNERWRGKRIEDDPVVESNTRGMVTFAMGGPNSRTTQFFINYGDNAKLDKMGFAPFGKVRDMAAVDKLYKEYGEGAPRGKGPSQGKIQMMGNEYLKASFPNLDYIKQAAILDK